VSQGKLTRKTSSHKQRERDRLDTESRASTDALALEEAVAREVESKIKRYQKLIIIGIALALAGGGAYAMNEETTSDDAQGNTDLWTVAGRSLSGTLSTGKLNAENADNPQVPLVFETIEARREATVKAFEALRAADPNGGLGHLALLGLASQDLNVGDGAAAQKHLTAFLAKETQDNVFRRGALVMQAHAEEASGNGKAGAATLIKMGDAAKQELNRLVTERAGNPSDELKNDVAQQRNLVAELYVEAAAMHRRAGDTETAIATLKKVTEDEEVKQATNRYRADEELSVLGQAD
jgi:hypothetical protein